MNTSKLWFALHLLEAMFQPSDSGKSFIFNMSVGYNLEGIKQPPMQQFIDNMMDASDHPKFAQYRDALNKLLRDEAFLARHGLQENAKACKPYPLASPPAWYKVLPSPPCTAVLRMKSKPFAATCWKKKDSTPL